MFEEIFEPIKPSLLKVEEKIKNIFHNPLFPPVPDKFLKGKRLRPALSLFSSFAFKEPKETKINVALACELMHFASLIHDDVVDEAVERRNTQTLNSKFGNHSAVLLGDFVFAKAMEYISITDNRELFKILSKTSAVMCEGEIIDEFLPQEKRFDENIYIKLIEKKTASLFSAACEMGAIVNSGYKRELLKEFGKNFGIFFQILDDLSDFIRKGEDIKNSKITLPHIIFRDKIREKFPEFLNKKDPKLSEEVQKYLMDLGAEEKCKDYIKKFSTRIKVLIDNFEEPLKHYLLSFVGYIEQKNIEIFKEGSTPSKIKTKQ